MSTKPLSEQLEYFKIERPSEFMMAEWIKDAKALEAKLDAETKHNEILTTANAEYMETIEASKEQTRLREVDYWLLEAKLAAVEALAEKMDKDDDESSVFWTGKLKEALS
jgi:hypothetical protein